jgi:putative flippase GtrA
MVQLPARFTRARLRAFTVQVAKFGAVGAVGLVVDVTVFNLLRATVLSPEHLASGPIIAKVISTAIAILVNWVGNRFWTFGSQRTGRTVREGVEFFAVSIAGMGISVGCLWFSREVLGYTSLLADNIASNVIGLALGAAFRFLLYRYWVFAPSRALLGGERPAPQLTGS